MKCFILSFTSQFSLLRSTNPSRRSVNHNTCHPVTDPEGVLLAAIMAARSPQHERRSSPTGVGKRYGTQNESYMKAVYLDHLESNIQENTLAIKNRFQMSYGYGQGVEPVTSSFRHHEPHTSRIQCSICITVLVGTEFKLAQATPHHYSHIDTKHQLINPEINFRRGYTLPSTVVPIS